MPVPGLVSLDDLFDRWNALPPLFDLLDLSIEDLLEDVLGFRFRESEVTMTR